MRKRTDPAATTRLHVPAWYDRLARHPDARPVSWIIVGCCILVSAVTLTSFFVGRPPADASTTDTASPTPDAGYTTILAEAPAAPARSDTPQPDPARPSSPTPDPSRNPAPDPAPRQAPAPQAPDEPAAEPPDTHSAPDPAPEPAEPAPEPEPTKSEPEPSPLPKPHCSIDGVRYAPGEPGYDECREPRRGPDETMD